MSDDSTIDRLVDELDAKVSAYCSDDPLEELRVAIRTSIEEHNSLIAVASDEHAGSSEAIDASLEESRRLLKFIEEADLTLEKSSSDSRLMSERNAVVEKYNALIEKIDRAVDRHNSEVERHDRESHERVTLIERQEAELGKRAREYQEWLSSDGPVKMARSVYGLYAEARQKLRMSPDGDPVLHAGASRLAAMRQRLGESARRRGSEMKDGVLIVAAEFGAGEVGHLVVDTGATVTSVTMELVRILGIEHCVGEEVEVRLANDMRIRAPRLSVPTIRIGRFVADHVKALVLKESTPGIDGTLGLSFLGRFDSSVIIGGSGKRLLLEPLKVRSECSDFDVFICHKSGDSGIARDVFDAVAGCGLKPFLSEVSLMDLGTTEFHRAINMALETCPHMIVICSSRRNVNEPWVASEWELFDAMLRSGRKQGNIIPLLCSGMEVHDLPVALGRYHAVCFDKEDWRESVRRFLPESPRRSSDRRGDNGPWSAAVADGNGG